MTKIRKATTEDIIRIHECLKDKIEVCGDHQCRFVDDHTDETVAAALGVGVASVANIRRKMFGNIRRAPNPCPEDREVRARFDDLIGRLNSLFNGELDDLKFGGGRDDHPLA